MRLRTPTRKDKARGGLTPPRDVIPYSGSTRQGKSRVVLGGKHPTHSLGQYLLKILTSLKSKDRQTVIWFCFTKSIDGFWPTKIIGR